MKYMIIVCQDVFRMRSGCSKPGVLVCSGLAFRQISQLRTYLLILAFMPGQANKYCFTF
jgi:hypothetical protein